MYLFLFLSQSQTSLHILINRIFKMLPCKHGMQETVNGVQCQHSHIFSDSQKVHHLQHYMLITCRYILLRLYFKGINNKLMVSINSQLHILSYSHIKRSKIVSATVQLVTLLYCFPTFLRAMRYYSLHDVITHGQPWTS